jgi:molybdate transport system regulatory protein
MGMSYKRAWQLVDELNRSFAEPLVATSKGGARGGGAALTSTGDRVLAAYRDIQRKAQRSFAPELRKFSRMLAK